MKTKWIQIWLTVSSLFFHALAGIAFDPQRNLPSCPPSQHLDISSLECTACDNGLISNADGGCVCPPRSFLSVNTSSFRTSCVSCPTNEVSSIDGLFCASCPQNATISTSGECKCPAGRILVETVEPMNRLKTFQCVDCPINAYPNANQTACVSCPDPVMTSTVNGSGYICSCPSDYVANPRGNACIPADAMALITPYYQVGMSDKVTYYNLLGSSGPYSFTVTSELFQSTYLKAAHQCLHFNNRTACQRIANLCVLQMYDEATEVCNLYKEIGKLRGSSKPSFANWPDTLPWLYYGLTKPEDPERTLRSVMNLTVTFAEHGFKQGETNMLKFVLAKYALNGEFLGFEALTDQLQICEQTIPPTNAYLQIGANYKSGCLVNLYELLEKEKYKQTLFFDPYLVDSTNELYPIPVRIRNFRSRGDFPNLNADKDSIADDRFVRRFFTVDTASSAITEAGQPIVVRVAETIRLRIEKSPTASSRINTPLIEITYAERQVSALSKSDSSSVSLIPIVFSTEYTMSVESLWSNLPTILLVISMVIVFGFFLRASFYFKRNHRGNVDINLKMAIQYLAMIASIAGPIFFLLLFGTSAYFAIFFKFQTVMYILLPESAGFTPFLNLLIASCVFQVFHVVKELVDQCSIDIFFIDWEKTRARVVSADNESKPAPVSIWRTLFMVNEWNELQTYRLVKVEMILFGMILILDYAGLRFAVASSRPSLMDSPADVNPILLFAVNTFTWGCLAAVLFIIKAGLIARYHSNPPLQYVDLLSVSNVSVLIFDEHHHGYYIHGRSVHGYADTDMITLNNDLKREETDLVGKRGLNGSENQVFEVFMAPDFRKTYDQIYNVMVGEESARKMLAKREKGEPLIKRIDGNKPQIASSKSLKAYEAINMFLCSFFDNHFREHRYCVRERSYFDKLLQTVPDNFTETILYSDTSISFVSTTLRGLELRLLLLYITLYNLIDISYSSNSYSDSVASCTFPAPTSGASSCYLSIREGTILAAVCTYIMDIIIRFVRSYFGQKNIAKKTLVDDKFLV